MNRYQNFKQKAKDNFFKAKIFASNPRSVSMLLPVLKAAKKKDYRKAMELLSTNPDIQNFMVKNEDKIKGLLMKYGGEIKYLLEVIESMKSFNQVYKK